MKLWIPAVALVLLGLVGLAAGPGFFPALIRGGREWASSAYTE